MSDSAFKTAAYPGYTTAQLRTIIEERKIDGFYETDASSAVIEAEIKRREAVANGDVSQMTDGEHLRYIRSEQSGTPS